MSFFVSALETGRFKAVTESNAGGKYLVISMGKAERIISYQLEMSRHNPQTRYLPMEKIIDNDRIKLYYKLGSAIPLNTLTASRQFSWAALLQIVENIAAALLDSRNLLLQEHGFILEPAYIYVHPVTLETALVYLPLPQTGDVRDAFRALIRGLPSVMALGEKEEGLLANLAGAVEKEDYTLPVFLKFMKELKFSSGASLPGQSGHSLSGGKPFCLEVPAASPAGPANVDGGASAAGRFLAGGAASYLGLALLLASLDLFLLKVRLKKKAGNHASPAQLLGQIDDN